MLLESSPVRNAAQGQKFEYRDYTVTNNSAYYYAVFFDIGDGILAQELRVLENYIKYPVKIKFPEIISEETARLGQDKNSREEFNTTAAEEILTVIKNYFLPGNYLYTIEKMKNYLAAPLLNQANRRDAVLYAGRSFLALGDSKNAMRYFSELKNISPDEGIFWIDRTVERMNNP